MIMFIYGLLVLLPLVIIIMNGIAMLKHRTNKLCAFAICAAMLSVMINCLGNIGAGATHIPFHTLDILFFTSAGLNIVTVVLAVLGLIQVLIKRRYVRGRWRAVIALLIGSAYIYSITTNMIEGLNHGIAWTQLLRPRATLGKPIVNETWNFQVIAPAQWDEVTPEAFGPAARMALQRKQPAMFSLIFADDLPEGSELTLADYMDMQKQTIRENTKGAEFLGEEEQKERSFTARTMEMRGHELINPQFHVFWILRDGNTMYRIATWGPNAQAKLVREEARKILQGFDLIQHRNKPKSTPKPTVAMLTLPSLD